MGIKYLQYIICGCLLICATACNQDYPELAKPERNGELIYLAARVNEATKVTRAPYDPPQTNNVCLPTNEKPLNVSVWATTTPGSFEHKTTDDGKLYDGSIGNEVAIHTSAHFQSGEPQLLGQAIYPTPTEVSTVNVDFIGFHPKSDSWDNPTEGGTKNFNKATFTFSGKEDVMFAPKITGQYGLNYEVNPALVPTFHFYHLLTWLNIKIVADMTSDDPQKREEVSNAWGKITSLTITSNKTVTINNLGTTGIINKSEFENPENVAFTNETNLSFFSTGSDDPFPGTGTDGYQIPITETLAAYVMCAPVLGVYKYLVGGNDVLKPEYTLHLVTSKRTVDIPIDLKIKDFVDTNGDGIISDSEKTEDCFFRGNTMGKQFTIVLNFKMGDVISVSTEISVGGDADWFTQGTGTGDLKEGDLEPNAGNN